MKVLKIYLVYRVVVVQISINRPERRNAFRPHTVKELMRAFTDARDDSSIGVVILTGKVLVQFCQFFYYYSDHSIVGIQVKIV